MLLKSNHVDDYQEQERINERLVSVFLSVIDSRFVIDMNYQYMLAFV